MAKIDVVLAKAAEVRKEGALVVNFPRGNNTMPVSYSGPYVKNPSIASIETKYAERFDDTQFYSS